tara:strand:+ start:3334 stop:4047 length:714 start_codon:yes stop_codon:yes gene_type:complete
MNYSIIILCGGKGSRLSKVLPGPPKILSPIGKHTFFDYFIKWLKNNNSSLEDLILAMGFKSDLILNYIRSSPLKLNKIIENKQEGTLPAVINAAKIAKNNDILILNGDTVFDVCFETMYSLYLKDKSSPLLCLRKIKSDKNIASSGYKFDSLKKIKYTENNAEFISCGAFFCSKSLLNYNSIANLDFGKTKKYDLDSHYLSKANCRPFWAGNSYMIDIGTPDSYLQAQDSIPKYVSL